MSVLSFSFGGGYSLKIGKVFDKKGGESWFLSHGPTVGLSLGVSLENTVITPNSENSVGFSVNRYAGSSAGYSGGVGAATGSVSGTFDRSGSSTATEFMRIPQKEGGYTEFGGGASKGIQLGGHWSQTKTTLR